MTRLAIGGNPNAGKTSIFNHLTGTVQHVSNYPGVTVERKEGTARFNGRRVAVLDLPGTYSLTAYSLEEIVARRAIIDEKPDVVVNVVDASNLERNLYLTVQLLEMEVPLVIALNMIDVAEKRGYQIDVDKLSSLLGVPVVPTVGSRGKGLDRLLEVALNVADGKVNLPRKTVTYGHEVNREIERLAGVIETFPDIATRYRPRWVAVKIIEEDDALAAEIRRMTDDETADRIASEATRSRTAIEQHFDDDAITLIAERRYGYAAGAIKESISLTGEARQHKTDQIDSVVCHRLAGPLLLFGVVAALFFFVFKVSDEWRWVPWFGGWISPTGFMQWIFERLSEVSGGLESRMPVLHSLVDDGLIGGVGGVMGFVPLIFFLFLFISFLEDSGYIARVAFILDRVLRAFGLQGKSILALIVSGGLGAGGCAVPGVMATRTLREEKDRLVTMLVVPFMNCGAKMPVYAMLIAAFFTRHRTQMMLLLWAISWIVALCAAWVLRRFVIRGEQTPFVMELPPYHLPTLRGVLLHTWERTWMYVKKAGTIILAMSVLLWVFMYFPQMPEEEIQNLEIQGASANQIASEKLAHSLAGRVGTALEPISQWAGFDWRTNVALVGGFVAKEIVVGTLGTVYAMGDVSPEETESLSDRLRKDPDWGPLKGFVLMLFVMLYAPCFVTIAVIRRESGTWRWALFSTLYSTSIAFVLATLVYQIGKWIS
ncbi:ferrous iron transport protein B [bacterium]|nr:ferrous iron transport protein B [bacterium]